MKIFVRDESQSTLGAIQVKIKDLSSEFEKITVRVLRLEALEKQILKIEDIIRNKPPLQGPRTQTRSLPVIKRPPAPQKPGIAPPKTFEISFALPSLALPKLAPILSFGRFKKKLLALSRLSQAITGVLCAAAIVALVVSLRNSNNPAHQADAGQRATAPALTRGTPTYPTLLPAGKSAADFGGWTRISPPNRDPVFAYVDKVGNVSVDVSEQPLPDKFKSDTAAQIAQLAQNFNAGGKITAGGTTAYIGTASDGPQSVILSKDNLLILIKSTAPLTNDQWAGYINALQ